jgi:hypothetical protein
MGIEAIEQLLRENRAVALRERRSAERKPFACPVKVVIGRDQEIAHEAFSRDISSRGIGMISHHEFRPNVIATIQIHTLTGEDVAVRAKLRWCLPYGEDWFASGWIFLSPS